MDCKKIEKFIISYIYEELPRRKNLKVEAHFSVCEKCRTMLKEYRIVMALKKERMMTEPPASLDDLILSRARQEISSRKRLASTRSPLKPYYPSWALAATLIGVFMFIWYLSPQFSKMVKPENKTAGINLGEKNVSSNRIKVISTPDIVKTEVEPKVAIASKPASLTTKPKVKIEKSEEKVAESEYSYTKHPIEPYDDSFGINRSLPGVDFVTFQHRKGLELKNLGNCQDANYIFERIIREHPKYQGIRNVYMDSADCYAKMGDKGHALDQLELMVKIFPQDEEEIHKLILSIKDK